MKPVDDHILGYLYGIDGELTASAIALNLDDSVSYGEVVHRLSILEKYRLVEKAKDEWGYYGLTQAGFAYLEGELEIDTSHPDKKNQTDSETETQSESTSPIEDEVTDALARYERTIDHQVEFLNGIDDKAQTVVQYTGVVLGLLATFVSLIPRINGIGFSDIPESSKVVFIFGAILLLGAIVGGMITYLSSVITYGLGPKFGSSVAGRRIESPIYEESILNSYSSAVDENHDVINKNAIRFRMTLEILISGLSLLALSGLYIILSVPLVAELLLFVLWLLLMGAILVYIHREEYLVLDRK